MRTRVFFLIAALALFALVLSQCARPFALFPQQAAPEYKLAAIFPGVITDGDYNALGYIAITSVQSELGLETVFSQKVAVNDVDAVMQQHIDAGSNILFVHGAQFFGAVMDMAQRHPEITFIVEHEGAKANPQPNVWIIDRNFHLGFYVLGALAALQSQTGHIAYVGGMPLPGNYSEIHAVEQAIDDLGMNVALDVVWVNDFNDPANAYKVGRSVIADGADVILGSLNLGMLGLFEAAKISRKKVWIAAKYTDKSAFAPNNYLTSVEYDFARPLADIVSSIMKGEKGGYYPLELGEHIFIPPPKHVSDEVWRRVERIMEGIQSGEIIIEENTAPVRGF